MPSLLGRNAAADAAAGAISIIQNDPKNVDEASALLRFGNHDSRHFEALVTHYQAEKLKQQAEVPAF